jgi:hypothetical protein
MMNGEVREYRYSSTARQRAVLLLIGSIVTLVVLLVFLGRSWGTLGLLTHLFGGVLVLLLLGVVRSQAARLLFRCRVYADRLELVAPLAGRVLRWSDIVEVRRITLRQLGGERRWTCAVYTRTPRNTTVPTYAFDDQLERAEEALAEVIRHTPHALHKG